MLKMSNLMIIRLATECDIAVELKHPRRDAISSQKKKDNVFHEVDFVISHLV